MAGRTEQIHELLTTRIMDHTYEPGSPLRIDTIARELGVSPTPVREALLLLDGEGLAVRHGSRGYFTPPLITRAELADLWELRLVLEPWAAARAARLGATEGRQRLASEATSEPDLGTYRAMFEHDQRFHAAVFSLAGNASAAHAFDRARVHVRIFRIALAAQLGNHGLREHSAVAQAVLAGDETASANAMRAHLEGSYERLAPALT